MVWRGQYDNVTPWHCDNVTRPHLSVGQVSMKKAAYPCPAKQGNTTRTPSAPVLSSVMLFIFIQTNKVCSGLCLHCCVWQQNHLPAPSWPTCPRGAFQLELNLQLIKYTDMSLFFNDGEKAIIDLQLQKQYSGWKKDFWDVQQQKLTNAAKIVL